MNVLNGSHPVFCDNKSLEKLDSFVKDNDFSSVFVLIDDNTEKCCLSVFDKYINFNYKSIQIASGETFKTLETCSHIWQKLSDEGADRKSLLLNLGGGVVTDIGGFVASCYKRGIPFVHIPTSLLGMVDAAIGGKNGVDFKNLKNQIGVIRNPKMVLIYKEFLSTLAKEQIISGFAEMLKHGLIDSEVYFFDCIEIKDLNLKSVSALIDKSVEIKSEIVMKDAEEKGLRKVLNYGHTLGHAIESYRMTLESSRHLLHGEAIAIGLILETYISHKLFGFPEKILNQLTTYIHQLYKIQYFDSQEQIKIIDFMKFDKKNFKDQINFVLLKNIGEPVFDCKVENQLIFEAFKYYIDSKNLIL